MRQQNAKATVPLEVVPERRTERCSPRFRPGGRFWSQASNTCRQAGREWKMSTPFVDSARLIVGSNSYKYNSILFINSMWYVQVCLGVVIAVLSHYKSCMFPYGTRWCILAQNTWHPRMCIRCKNKIVRYIVWISFSALPVKTLWDSI